MLWHFPVFFFLSLLQQKESSMFIWIIETLKHCPLKASVLRWSYCLSASLVELIFTVCAVNWEMNPDKSWQGDRRIHSTQKPEDLQAQRLTYCSIFTHTMMTDWLTEQHQGFSSSERESERVCSLHIININISQYLFKPVPNLLQSHPTGWCGESVCAHCLQALSLSPQTEPIKSLKLLIRLLSSAFLSHPQEQGRVASRSTE